MGEVAVQRGTTQKWGIGPLLALEKKRLEVVGKIPARGRERKGFCHKKQGFLQPVVQRTLFQSRSSFANCAGRANMQEG